MLRAIVLAAVGWLGCQTASMAFEEKALVTVEPPDDFSVAPGESKDAEIQITVTDGFHVQANPAANEFLIPLNLELESEDDLEFGDVRYPPGVAYRIKGTDEDLLTYEGTFTVSVSIRAKAFANKGIRTARGRLRYQACDDRACLRPAELSFDFKARIDTAPKQ